MNKTLKKHDLHLDYIDFIKGFAILGVVAVHTLGNKNIPILSTWLYFFMITVFYIIPGWLANIKNNTDINIKSLIKKRLISLGIPYVSFSILIILFDLVLCFINYYSFSHIISDIYFTLSLAGIGTLWFLPTIFIAEIVFYWVLKKENPNFWFLLIFIFSIGANIILNEYRTDTRLFQLISSPIIAFLKGIIGSLFLFGGYLACKLWTIFENKFSEFIQYIFVLFITCISIFLCNITPRCSFNALNSKMPLRWTLVSFLAGISITLICKTFFSKLNINNPILKFISFFGKNSLIVMCSHYSFLLPLYEILLPSIKNNVIFLFFFVILIEVPIIFIVNNKIPSIIGKGELPSFISN